MTELEIAKSAFEFVSEADKKFCERMGMAWEGFKWGDMTLRQNNQWCSIAKWFKENKRKRSREYTAATPPPPIPEKEIELSLLKTARDHLEASIKTIDAAMSTIACKDDKIDDQEKVTLNLAPNNEEEPKIKFEPINRALCQGMPHGSCKGKTMCDPARACFRQA
jgi:hypothetical protein